MITARLPRGVGHHFRNVVYFGTTLVCLLAFSVGHLLYGQATGSISGTVSDASGSAVPGARVTVTVPTTGFTRSAITNERGEYIIPLLGVAIYNLKVENSGFAPATVENVRLQVDEHRELDFKLSPATVQTSVEVSATPVAVQTADGTLGQVITTQQVSDLPLNGRDFVQLATLTPGTSQETNPNSFFNAGPSSEASARGSFSLSVGGSRANSTDWLLDGNDNNELTAGAISILSSIDSIQEFKVLTYNYSAEWGTRGGPTVLVTTKSGTDQFHGSLFEFLRNTSLDARSFFAASTEKFNLNQFGASLGGPIKKDKVFFFADYEQKYQRHAIPFTGLVPSVAQRNGDFSHDAFGNPTADVLINPYATQGTDANPTYVPFQCSGGSALPAAPNGSQASGTPCNIIPQNLIDPVGRQLINLYPLPNANNAALGYNFVSQPVRKLDEGKFDIRVDENLSTKDTLFSRFSYDQAGSYVPGGAPGFAEQGPFASNQSIANHARNAAISETHVFSPTMVNQASAGFNRIFDYITSQGNNSCYARAIGIPGANLGGGSCGLTSVEMTTYWSLGDRGYAPFIGGTNVWSFSDSLDIVRGKHDLRIGGMIRANQLNTVAVGFPNGFWVVTGLWTGEPAADLLTGLTSLAIHDQEFGGSNTGRRWKLYRPFIQDDWRVSKNLTLNLGLAWAMMTPQTEVGNRQSDFDPASGKFLVAGQGADARAGVQMDWTALEPRLGAAWKPFGKSNTVVRGGYAIYHDSSWNMGAQGLWQNPPYYAESGAFAFGGTCTFATAVCASRGLTPSAIAMSAGFPTFAAPPNPADFEGTILSQNRDFKQGRIQQFNVNLEQELPGQVVVTAGYAGSRSSHILVFGNNVNVGSPSACGTVKGYTMGCGPNGAAFGVPYPAFPFSEIDSIFDAGLAHYNSLQIKAETKSARHGLYALIGYTYSRAYDTGFSDGLGSIIGATYFPLPNWQKLDWGLSQINLNHNFTASVIYQLPLGRGHKWGNKWNSATNAIGGGWELTVIEKATSGFPVFVVDGNNGSGANLLNTNVQSLIRPDQVCNPVLSHPTLSEWFNPACFAQPAPGELGNANRTPLSGPDFVNTDFSIIKHFEPHERVRVDFRAEFFNLFNHPQFGAPGGNGYGADFASPSTFAVVNYTVNNPRLVQFALKLAF
ncbi:MAG TPA: carboxypeptidase-like regulatory domain-containing protein [Bryobacteraceae bacterium]|nr:carboxypeptidase-like regulatory domain-containing protein [Bryobacteraceae bacterium]